MSKMIRSDDVILTALLKIQYVSEVTQKEYEYWLEKE